MWTKKHKLFFAALLASKIPSLDKKQLKKQGFSGEEITQINTLANQFKTGEIIQPDKIPGCMAALEKLIKNRLETTINFLIFCEYIGRLNANALTYLCNQGLYKDEDNRSPIFFIAQKGSKEDAEQLLTTGIQIDVIDKYGYTPLMLACINNNIDVAAAFLARGAKANHQDKEGVTPLHFAAQLGHVNLFSLLIKHGAHINAKAKNGVTPFTLAIFANHLDAARALAKDFKCFVDNEDNLGEALLQTSCREYNSCITQKNMPGAEKQFAQIAFLLEMGADVNRSFVETITKAKINYLAQAMLGRIYHKNLVELDYQLVSLFIHHHFDLQTHFIFEVSILNFILNCQDVRLAQCCHLTPANSQSLVSIESSKDDKIAYMFTPMALSKEQASKIAETLQPIFDEYLMNFYSQLHQEIFDNTNNLVIPAAANIPATPTTEKGDSLNTLKKQALAKDIIVILEEYFESFKLYKKDTIPNWCKEITIDKLMLKNIDSLVALKSKVQQWGETTLRQLQAKHYTSEDKKESEEPKLIPAVKEALIQSAVYEETLKYSRTLMHDINDTCCLLLPFNTKGDHDVEVIVGAANITATDYLKFKRVIAEPKISSNPNQPGIRFLTDSNYFCNVMINNKECCKLLIAEIKIADSPNRIALYRLAQEGQGKMVLALGPYVENGFHDTRYQKRILPAHPLNLSEKFISELERKLAPEIIPTPLTAPPVNLTLWQTRPIPDHQGPEKTATATVRNDP
jgi:ankyrin repeat protein